MDEPAFPQTRTLLDGSSEECEGLTMRDYFAAKVVQGTLAGDLFVSSDFEEEIEFAYRIADAMLEARKRKKKVERKWINLTIDELEDLGKKYVEKDGCIRVWGLFYQAIETKLRQKNT